MAKSVNRADYLKWMALESRTNKWSAFVAYDRDQCNRLLRQEYIEKFDSDSYMPPIDDTYATGLTTWYWLNDYQTDVARLSFENNPDENGNYVAEANMSMAIVGGTEIEMFTNAGGTAEVVKIGSYDPLDHPELKANRVLLKDIRGEVDQGGTVVLDLGDPATQRYTWELTGSRIEHVRRVGGAYFKRKFREADPERRTFKLGQLAHTEQEFLKPAKFKLRTVMEEGANVRNAANFGNGALELRIAMKGELEGGTPGEDWYYPIPNDMPGINASLMLSNQLFMRKIIAEAVVRAFGTSMNDLVEFSGDTGLITNYQAKPESVASIKMPPVSFDVVGHNGLIEHVTLGAFPLKMYVDQDRKFGLGLGSDYLGMGIAGGDAHGGQIVNCVINGRSHDLWLAIGMSGRYLLSIDEERKRLVIKVESLNFDSFAYSPNADISLAVRNYLNNKNTEGGFRDDMAPVITGVVINMLNSIDAIDLFVANSLLFNSTDAVEFQTVHTPGDFLSFASISPRLTTFAVEPQEKILSYGETFTFSTSPVTPGVKWSVSNLDGTTAGAGTIDANSGRYIAPGLDQIEGTYKRVKITATGGGSAGKPHISKALITIAARAITLNPLVQTCPASGEELQKRDFSASAMSGALKWTVIGEGTMPQTSPDRGNVYTAPPQQKFTDKTFVIEQVKVETSQHSQTSYVVVTHNIQGLVMKIETQGLPPGQAQFSATSGNQELPAPPTWKCFPETGAGTIDQTGLYKADPNSQHQFVIITVSCVLNGTFFLGDAFSIQPLPLGPMPPRPDPEAPQRGADGMPEV